MHKNKLMEELIKKILEKSITTFSSNKQVSLARLQIQNEIKDRWNEITRYTEWEEYIKEINIITDKEISTRLLNEKNSFINGKLYYDKQKEILEKSIAEFKEQDVICKRLLQMKDYIEYMFPLDGNKDIKEQIIRSRGLVLSSIASGKSLEPTDVK
jgi:hypothetical protein